MPTSMVGERPMRLPHTYNHYRHSKHQAYATARGSPICPTDHAHRYHPNRTMRTMRTKRTICARGGHDAVLAGALEQAGHPGLDKHVRVVHHHRRVRREPQRVQREVSLPSTALGTRQRR